MSQHASSGTASINTADEQMHPIGAGHAWSESYYFNFVDPATKLAMFTRMGFRPGDRWADGLHAVYLGGDRVAFTYSRREIGADLTAYNGNLEVGGLRLDCIEPFGHWRIRYEGPAQDIADAAILLERSKSRPEGWFKPATLQMSVDFKALSAPHYSAQPADGPTDRGHFEHTGEVTGEISIGGVTHRVQGYGVRDKSWGPRDWGQGAASMKTDVGSKKIDTAGQAAAATPASANAPAPFVNWFSMNFGPDLALGGACGRTADGELRGAGWILRDGVNEDLEDVRIESRYKPGSILHTDIRLTGRSASGRAIAVDGRILTICPTKIPMPGGATFVNEGLAQFSTEGRTGFGISEHWHMVQGT